MALYFCDSDQIENSETIPLHENVKGYADTDYDNIDKYLNLSTSGQQSSEDYSEGQEFKEESSGGPLKNIPKIQNDSSKIKKISNEDKLTINKRYIGSSVTYLAKLYSNALKSDGNLQQFINKELKGAFLDCDESYFMSETDLLMRISERFIGEVAGKKNINRSRDYRINSRDAIKNVLDFTPQSKPYIGF